MEVMIAGGLIRGLQGLASAAPTLLIGLMITAMLHYYLGAEGSKRLFGGDSIRSLPQSWLIGMLLPVCSIGVLPIILEMKRIGIRRGAITAFALSAPLFNPLSLLYGLTLSRPIVIIGFAVASLLVVTLLGLIWDRMTQLEELIAQPDGEPEGVIGLRRLMACFIYSARLLTGKTGLLALIAVAGLVLLGGLLPHGALQTSVEQSDLWAPLKMAAVALPIYATPMLTMSQLGMMFDHGNSPGASFCLLLLGTGINLATVFWTARSYGIRETLVWLCSLFVIVLGLAYLINKPLIPPGVEPAGHTHAFDIYTNPLHQGMGVSLDVVYDQAVTKLAMTDKVGLIALAVVFLIGLFFRYVIPNFVNRFMQAPVAEIDRSAKGLNSIVSPRIVGLTGLGGLVALSIVGCFAYYPDPSEVLQEMKLARVEVLSGALTGTYDSALHWIPVLDEWSRRLEVGTAIRKFELRPYQRAQTALLRKKLERLEHELEHAMDANKSSEQDASANAAQTDEIKAMISSIGRTSQRVSAAFRYGDLDPE